MSAPKKRAPAKPKKTPVKAKKKKVTALKTPKVLSTALQKKLVAEAVGRSFGKITQGRNEDSGATADTASRGV